MKKRVACVMLAFAVSFAALAYRLEDISVQSETAVSVKSGVLLETASVRGTIFDCNMQPLTNAERIFTAVAKPTQKAVSAFENELSAEEFEEVREKLLSGRPVTVTVSSLLCENGDVRVVSVPLRYSSSACHVVGYTDGSGSGVSGVEKAFDTILAQAGKQYFARVETDAQGRVLLGKEITADNVSAPTTGVMLTIDADIQKVCENALDNSEGVCSAAVVIDINSGAIRACVSRPDFNQYDVASSLDDENSPLINRAFSAFSVGSVFKPVVAAAALENGIGEDFSYECTGSITLNGVTFNCHNHEGHGKITMRRAVADSCNTYFIALAREVGAEKIIATASDFGFGKETVFADGMRSVSGNLPTVSETDSDAALANLSFGQGALTATPVQICAMYAAIANGGIYVEPCLTEGKVNEDGTIERFYEERSGQRIISSQTAEKLKEFLFGVVEDGSGRRAWSETVECAGKTATAQTGRTENGEEIFNAWFAGFARNYAIVVMKENGGEGAISCAPLFKEIAENLPIKN